MQLGVGRKLGKISGKTVFLPRHTTIRWQMAIAKPPSSALARRSTAAQRATLANRA